MNQDAEFPARHWEDIRSRIESGGAGEVIEFVRGFEDRRERRRLFAFAQQALFQREWEGKTLDPCLTVARAAIDEVLDQSNQLTDMANAMSYNLSADLAPCWPGDELPRDVGHFEAGLDAANDCIRWRETLDKPAQAHSIAWWAKGIHELALGRAAAAAESFGTGLSHALKDDPEGESFNVILAKGFTALAGRAAGREGAPEDYEAALARFRAQVEAGGEAGEDAAFGIEQLETTRSRLVPDGA